MKNPFMKTVMDHEFPIASRARSIPSVLYLRGLETFNKFTNNSESRNVDFEMKFTILNETILDRKIKPYYTKFGDREEHVNRMIINGERYHLKKKKKRLMGGRTCKVMWTATCDCKRNVKILHYNNPPIYYPRCMEEFKKLEKIIIERFKGKEMYIGPLKNKYARYITLRHLEKLPKLKKMTHHIYVTKAEENRLKSIRPDIEINTRN